MNILSLVSRFLSALGLAIISSIILGFITWKLLGGLNRIEARLNPWSGDNDSRFPKQLKTALLGGLVGGVAFAAVSPVVGPAIIDTQVNTGIVEKPEPDIWSEEVEDPSASLLESYGLNSSDDYSLYIVNISNDQNRPLYNYNINLRFPGCVESGELGLTNRGAAVMTNESESIQVGEFPDRPTNSTCYAALEADQFDPGNAIMVTYVVDATPEENVTNLYPEPTLSDSVLITDSYTWEYSGRTYADRPKLQIFDLNSKEWINP